MSGCSGPCDRCGRCRHRSRPQTRPPPLPVQRLCRADSSEDGNANTTSRMPRGLANRTAVPAASRTRCSRRLCLFPQPHDQQPLGRQPRRRMQQHGLVGASFVLAGPEHRSRGGLDSRVVSQQRGLRFGVGPFGGLRVGGQNSQQFGGDPRRSGQKKVQFAYCPFFTERAACGKSARSGRKSLQGTASLKEPSTQKMS